MFNVERREQILALVRERHSMTVHAIAARLYISESTVRRDLAELEREGKLRRTFGGAVLEETPNREVPLMLRQSQNHREKQEIAALCRPLLENGKVIFLDASTTVAHLVPHLLELRDLTVITNSPNIALELSSPYICTYCTGGLLLPDSKAFVGAEAEDFIRCFNADLMFFSSRGIDRDGSITDSSMEECRLRQVMLRQSARAYYLFDKSKLGRRYMINICRASELNGAFCEDGSAQFEGVEPKK